MSKPFPARGGRILAWAAGAVIMMGMSGTVSAQMNGGPIPVTAPMNAGISPVVAPVSAGISPVVAPVNAGVVPASTPAGVVGMDKASEGDVVQTGCSSCGGGTNYGDSGCSSCGGGCPSCCYAGRQKCDCCWDATTKLGKCCANIYECLCCPDPCYEPQWLPAANSAFFLDNARPITHMRLRYDGGFGLLHPDRAEFFQARAAVATTGPAGAVPGAGKGPAFIASRVNYQDLTVYNEAAVGNFGMFIEFLYRDLDPGTALTSPAVAVPHSGFGDMNIGTKSLLLDCELTQFTFQFKTFLPIGNFTQGMGTGHVSLEPSFLMSLKLTSDCYMQMQWAYWIPIAGDSVYQGNVFHQHYSLNKVLVEKCKGCCLVGTLEANHWSVLGGNFTSPDVLFGGTAVAASADTDMVTVGPGLRLFICNKYDIGVGSAFAVTSTHWADQLVRAEFRWRF